MLSVVASYIIGESTFKSEEEEKFGAVNKKSNTKYEHHRLDQTSEESSDTETVYGIRTNFNAVNEYLNLLIKY